MSDECEHRWGEAELCETPFGNVFSPTCRDCGAVKLVEERRRPVVTRMPAATAPISTNIPPAGAPAVHPYQAEFFTHL